MPEADPPLAENRPPVLDRVAFSTGMLSAPVPAYRLGSPSFTEVSLGKQDEAGGIPRTPHIETMATIGENIKKARNKLGLTQDD